MDWGREAMGKGTGEKGRRGGGREGGKRRGSSHAFCFSNLGSSATHRHISPPRIRDCVHTSLVFPYLL